MEEEEIYALRNTSLINKNAKNEGKVCKELAVILVDLF